MPPKPQESQQQAMATTLISVVQETFRSMSSLEFTKDPECTERDIIEYESRMRVMGLEKFNNPCFIASVSYYLSPQHQKNHDPCATIVLYLEEDSAAKMLKALGFKGFQENDDDSILEICGEFCTALAGMVSD